MNPSFDIPPLPTTETYLSAIEKINDRFKRIGSVRDALLSYIDTSQEVQRFTRIAVGLSMIVEPQPIEREVSIEPSYVAWKASVLGALAGLQVSLEVNNPIEDPTVLFDVIKVKKLNETDSMEDVAKTLSREIQMTGEIGMAHLGDEVLDRAAEWEKRITSDVNRQYIFRCNLALVAYAGYSFHESLRMTFCDDMSAHDWDEELRTFDFGNGDGK